ncbi:MAG: glycosyltransferase family 4 protein [Acidimicrobiia bacterium]|nr:glycosyltransferase family 4 protein [Acidimicrobiia bacterium]
MAGPGATEPSGLLGKMSPAALVDRREIRQTDAGIFGEPNGFSWRVARALRVEPRFDIVHDNQSLGYGLLPLRRRMPVTATIHHPLSVDRRIALEHTTERLARTGVQRFYRCTAMQARVARRLERVLTVSDRSRQDIARDFSVPEGRIDVVPVAVDDTVFRPLPATRPVPGRIVTTASSDQVLKGLDVLVRAMVDVRAAHPTAHLVVVGSMAESGATEQLIRRSGLDGVISFTSGLSRRELVELYATAEVACVPSLYEGFSLPAAEAMACGVPLVSTDGGALTDVAGPDGDAALIAPAGDARRLAARLIEVLGDPTRVPPDHRRAGSGSGRRSLELDPHGRADRGSLPGGDRALARRLTATGDRSMRRHGYGRSARSRSRSP